MKERARSLGGDFLDYDGCAQMWVKKWEDYLAFYHSKECATFLSEDCARFVALPLTFMVGYDNLVVGDASREMGGSDGIAQKSRP